MRRFFHHFALLLLTTVSVTHAGTTPPGVNLRWDRCFGDGGVQYRDFACDTNVGVELLVGTFELAADLHAVNGLECHLSVGAVNATLPVWWQFFNTESCRQTALRSTQGPPAGSAACEDWAPGLVSDNIGFYRLDRHDSRPNNWRIFLINAVQSENARDLVPGKEYHAFSLEITHAKTVGAGACGGCLEPVVIYFSGLQLTQEQQVGPSTLLWFGANESGSQWASWQQGYPINTWRGCLKNINGGCMEPTVYFETVPYSETPTRGTTWGQLKSLYR